MTLSPLFRCVGSAVVLLAFALGSGCDSGNDAAPQSLSASFTGSPSPAQANLVRFAGGPISGDVASVDVVVGGATTSTDLYGFAFDVVIGDPSVAEFLAGSATAGDALSEGAGSVTAQAIQSANRVIVGVTKLGTPTGNGVTTSEAVVVSLSFRVLKAGTTTLAFSGTVSAQNPTGVPVAFDSAETVVGSVVFDSAPASLAGL